MTGAGGMEDQKTFASLSPSLLARKGAARPAMRPQLQPLSQFHENVARQMDVAEEIEDDLGWNDHGEDAGEPENSSASETDSSEGRVVPIKGTAETSAPVTIRRVPEVVRQQGSIGDRISAPHAADARHDQPAPRRSALSRGGRAAFTLRLDAERHLKLRLACAMDNRSAQQIVTEALDRLIGEMPEIEPLAQQVRRRKMHKGDLS